MATDDITLSYIQDWESKAIAALPTMFRNQPGWIALARGFGAAAQLQEDANFDLLSGTTLELATGVHLDRWGDIVGQQRLDFSDTEYRGFIRARIIANTSKGHPDELLAILNLTMDPLGLQIVDMHPAGLKIYVLRASFVRDTVASAVGRIMDDAKPAGVTLYLVEALTGFFGTAGDYSESFTPYGPLGVDVGVLAREIIT